MATLDIGKMDIQCPECGELVPVAFSAGQIDPRGHVPIYPDLFEVEAHVLRHEEER